MALNNLNKKIYADDNNKSALILYTANAKTNLKYIQLTHSKFSLAN